MRIAFLGKGGSGKTTIAAFYALYADSKHYRVGLIDVDVNSHAAEVLGVDSTGKELAVPNHVAHIERYLAGANPRVVPGEFLNTTPPGRGSNYFTLEPTNEIVREYGVPFGTGAHVFTTGSYTAEGIGVACHHGTQQITENVLAHSTLAPNDMLIIDSVAGNDAFGNTLYAQDMLVLVVKPEREGVSVCNRFMALAAQAGVADRVFVIGNQVMTARQEEFLARELPANALLGCIRLNQRLIDDRLDAAPIAMSHVRQDDAALFNVITAKAKNFAKPRASIMTSLF